MNAITNLEREKNARIAAIKKDNERLMQHDAAAHAAKMALINKMRTAALEGDLNELNTLRMQLTQS